MTDLMCRKQLLILTLVAVFNEDYGKFKAVKNN